MMILKDKDKPMAKKAKTQAKKTSKIRALKLVEADLWYVFSIFIRLRDAGTNGVGNCITCGKPKHWQDADCGHGVGRGHGSTKYNEKNNHLQCKGCNGFNEGRKDLYEKAVDARYGVGTWAMLWNTSKKRSSIGRFEFHHMTVYYLDMINEQLQKKKLTLTVKQAENLQKISMRARFA